jgi:hypothetical protein
LKQLREITLITEEEDYVTMNLPLFIRLLEWSREDASDDKDIHIVAENAVRIGGRLTMEHYDKLIKINK